MTLPASIIIVIAILTLFLSLVLVLKYAVRDQFTRTRLIMSMFFVFIVATLSISFWQYTLATLPYSFPAGVLGVVAGYFLGVRAAEEKLRTQGLEYYMEHFAHVHVEEIKSLNWWALINFYSVMGGLVMINLIGLATVIYRGSEVWAIATSVVGALLLGTIIPYLVHLWSIRASDQTNSTTSEP